MTKIIIKSNSEINIDKSTVFGDENVVFGDGNVVFGNDCSIFGRFNECFGNRNIVRGNGCIINGNDCRVSGKDCKVYGERNKVDGKRCEMIVPSIGPINNPNDIKLLCIICMDEQIECLFVPCMHIISCSSCGPHYRKKSCPMCFEPIEEVEKVFISFYRG